MLKKGLITSHETLLASLRLASPSSGPGSPPWTAKLAPGGLFSTTIPENIFQSLQTALIIAKSNSSDANASAAASEVFMSHFTTRVLCESIRIAYLSFIKKVVLVDYDNHMSGLQNWSADVKQEPVDNW